DATHPEETRVVVLRGNRVEEFDFESANRKQLRGNIYLAKVTRVEPSLQAAFVEYGGNRHGFLAFSEIHPDYYQIPVADRQALIAEEERAQRAADDDADNRSRRGGRNRHRRSDRHRDVRRSEPIANEAPASDAQPQQEFAGDAAEIQPGEAALGGLPPEQLPETVVPASEASASAPPTASETPAAETLPVELAAAEAAPAAAELPAGEPAIEPAPTQDTGDDHAETGDHLAPDAAEPAPAEEQSAQAEQQGEQIGQGDGNGEDHAEDDQVENVGGADALEEAQERQRRVRPRQYKIQEVIKRRQVMLVQVVKEERGSKGAALTTYLSLAGRYSVLMPNTARGGGISRKITSGEDRSRLKEIAQELEVPEGMGVILRTAGASRTKTEVKRDFEYLLRLWETVRDLTLKSMAPKLVYEEGSLTKRSIRDLYSKDIDEIVVSGDDGYKEAREFMRMLMPSHAKNVKLYKDGTPLFTRYGIESQLDAMFSPIVQLRSGGYIVINQAEALVAIDVNSGRATREHHIEDTALKTNCEAAEEVARQLRLRDLAGLIVIDFIDMDEGRNNRTVERRLKDALKHDRARIQVGRISHFGLMEMSRQRIRTSVLESSTEKCPVCGGSGHVRSVSSVALQLLRAIEEMLNKGATHNLIVRTRSEVALYVLNHKRAHLRGLEERFRIAITISADATVTGQQSYVVDRGEQVHTPDEARALAAAQPQLTSPLEAEEDVLDAETEAEAELDPELAAAEAAEADEGPIPQHQVADVGEGEESQRETNGRGEGEREGGRRRRRRGRGRGRGGEPREAGAPREGAPQFTHEAVAEHAIAHEDHDAGSPDEQGGEQPQRLDSAAPGGDGADTPEGRRRRRRGRRGGRRNRQRGGEGGYQGGERPAAEMHAGSDFPPVSDQDADSVPPPFDQRPEPQAYQPPVEARSAYEQPPAPPPAPLPQAVEAQPAAGEQPIERPEPPRRRSTIREPAPIAIEGAPPPSPTIPPPTPVIVTTASEDSGQPKRGWWGKRLLGDKS
ncbi:MAG: Rne/Rng family ribonuclease, partial [Rhizobiales bacterium]|nr:Rne/Rng family ribonuclease [Hyphomicrobiales bacterium]